MSALSAAAVRRSFLEPAMDAIALNRRQTRLLANPDPELNSLTELAVALRDGAEPYELHALATLCVQLRDANAREGGFELLLAGAADDLAIDLHARERNGQASQLLGIRAAANALRAPLGVLQDPPAGDVLAVIDATRAVDRVLAVAPRAQLLCPALEHELGAAKFALLWHLADRKAMVG